MLKRLLAFAFLLGAAVPAFAQNGLTTATCTLSATIENISVVCPYTGDDNENATAAVQFRASGAMTWIDAYTPFIDRRFTLGGSTNTHARQARVSIVGSTLSATSPIAANTLYEVQITWTDPDGVTGSNPVLGTVTTYPTTPSIGTGTCAVTDDSTMTTCLGTADATHAHITVAAGAYAPIVVNHGGSAGAFVELDFANGAIVSAPLSSSDQAISVTAAYVWLKTPQVGEVYYSAIAISANDVYVTDVSALDISHGCSVDPASIKSQGAAGIRMNGTPNRIIISGGTLGSTELKTAPCLLVGTGTQYNLSPTNGVSLTGTNQDTIVIKGLTFDGGFRDNIGTGGTSAVTTNVDIIQNYFKTCKDDCGGDIKGANINTRVAENRVEPGLTIGVTHVGITCLASLVNTTAANAFGPMYIHHNYCHPLDTAADGIGTAFKSGGGQAFFFNNTLDGTLKLGGSSTRWASWVCVSTAGTPVCSQWKSLNNLYYSGGEAISTASASIVDAAGATTSISEWDYDVVQTTGAGSYIKDWNGSPDYTALTGPSGWTAASGQEVHGYRTNPTPLTWTNGVGAITIANPGYDKGVLITNFNSLDSAWPYSSSAPDIGAFELGGGPTPGSGPTAASVTSTTLTLNWNKATSVTYAQNTLTYYGCSSASAISSVAACLAATQLFNYTTDVNSAPLTGLTPLAVIHFNIIVKDPGGNTSLYSDLVQTMPCGPSKLVFTGQPGNAAINSPVGTVVVTVENASSMVCTDSSLAITIANTGGTCTGMTLAGTASGNALFGLFSTTNLSESAAGACTFTATASGVTNGVSGGFTIAASVNTSAYGISRTRRK